MEASRIAELFRQSVASTGAADEPCQAEDILAALERRADPEREGEPLDRILMSNQASALARIAMALQPEAEELSRDVAAIRRGRDSAAYRWRRHARSVIAMASVAGLAAMAVLVARVNHPVATPHPEMPVAQQGRVAPEDVIRSISFEDEGVAVVTDQDVGRIFEGDFDS